MFIMNLWLVVGFCNGLIGIVMDIINIIFYKILDLFVVVIVKFDNYIGFLLFEKVLFLVVIVFVIVFI